MAVVMTQFHMEQLIADFEKSFKVITEDTGDFETVMASAQWLPGHSAEGELGTWTLIGRNDNGFEFELTAEKVSARLTWKGEGDNWFFTNTFAFNATPLGSFIGTEPVSEDRVNAIFEKDLERLNELTELTKAFLV